MRSEDEPKIRIPVSGRHCNTARDLILTEMLDKTMQVIQRLTEIPYLGLDYGFTFF